MLHNFRYYFSSLSFPYEIIVIECTLMLTSRCQNRNQKPFEKVSSQMLPLFFFAASKNYSKCKFAASPNASYSDKLSVDLFVLVQHSCNNSDCRRAKCVNNFLHWLKRERRVCRNLNLQQSCSRIVIT